MTLSIQFLFSQPQHEVASLLRDRLRRCRSASLVAGFATVEGLEAILPAIQSFPTKLETFVVGAGTYRAYEAFDRLIATGVPRDRLFVHLGHSRSTGTGARHTFYRYHPMLHSKIYLMDFADGSTSVFVGSHNITGFALLGLNGEASVLIEGPSDSKEFSQVRAHIWESRAQSVLYVESMKEALSWWTTQFVEGLRDKVNDVPRDGEFKKTIVVLAVKSKDELPKKGDVIYFEIPAALGTLQSLNAEVHVYIFDTKLISPASALANIGKARMSLWCRTEGLETEQGGLELRANWYVDNGSGPILLPTPTPFRPTPSVGMQQVRVRVWNEVFDEFEYLFQSEKATWEPVFDSESHVQISSDEAENLIRLKLIPPEDKEWSLVRDLRRVDAGGNTAYQNALQNSSPEGGSFVLMSLRRRKLS